VLVEFYRHDSGQPIALKCEKYFDPPRDFFIVKKFIALRTSAVKEIYSRHDQGKINLSFWNLSLFIPKFSLSLYGPDFCKFHQN
jgi:hypothetical protein